MKDKLAEEIKIIAVSFFYWWYNKPGANTEEGFDTWWILYSEENNLSELDKAMQAYHEAKMKEVTDADIVKYAFNCYPDSYNMRVACVNGIRDMRDGKIKHSK